MVYLKFIEPCYLIIQKTAPSLAKRMFDTSNLLLISFNDLLMYKV
jgi:hypothetical protein